ncbi:hypothetical protein CBL_05966 [Carabus blaptoides fortunei]
MEQVPPEGSELPSHTERRLFNIQTYVTLHSNHQNKTSKLILRCSKKKNVTTKEKSARAGASLAAIKPLVRSHAALFILFLVFPTALLDRHLYIDAAAGDVDGGVGGLYYYTSRRSLSSIYDRT